ncbi:ribonuclease E/G [Clostridium malenominatum]|uniref:Ribonuclease E/G n=1 Tax=Clostridium malenominatum TaxID=1539 RepID=A0ABN1IPE6_9CLOT
MKEIFVERNGSVLRIAIKKNNKLKECFIEEDSKEPFPGEIYKGIVKNIIPGIKCAFIDIGHRENCYMYIDRKFKNTHLKKGDELLVEVVKEAIGKKGPKVTNAVAIPGRYCVLNTLDNNISFSQKIKDERVKDYIKQGIKKPEDAGLMIRTNASKVTLEMINEEVDFLNTTYKDIKRKGTYSLKPGLLYRAGGILGKILRDKLDEVTTKIYVNSEEDYEEVKNYITNAKDVNVFLQIHREELDLFQFYGIEGEILKLRNNKVQLNCGGYIIIEKTEAMYTIDVNSGKNIKGESMRKTAFITNIQAAEEIANQIRLRNLSGIILVDFIDMQDEEDKENVFLKLKEGFEEDKVKTVIYPFTELNLVQIARRRVGKAINEYMEEACHCCNGKGNRLKLSYINLLIRNEVKKVKENNNIKNIYIEVNDGYKKHITEDIISFIKEIDSLDISVYLKFTQGEEYYKVEPLLFSNQLENLKMYKIYG